MCGIPRSTVKTGQYVPQDILQSIFRLAARHGLGWPLPADLDDAALEARLFRRPAPAPNRARPDCAHIHRELKRNGVTLQLLWEEYLAVHPSGYRYTQFCEIYRQWARRLRPSMRQVHRAGEKTFIDFSGKRPTLVDRRTGELQPVELFVAVLGASSFTYAEATATQQLADWVDAHLHMVEYFGGATTLWVPDQLRSAITRPCRYEPDVNRDGGTGADVVRGAAATTATQRGRGHRHARRGPLTKTRSMEARATTRGPSDDSLTGGTGRDVLLGGEGADVAVYSDSPAGVTIFLDDTKLIVSSGGHAEGDILVGIEAVTGSRHHDLLDGTNNSTINWLSGGGGNDALWGGGHDHADSLVGGLANRARQRKLAECRRALCTPPLPAPQQDASVTGYRDRYEALTGPSLRQCPRCHAGNMQPTEHLVGAWACPAVLDSS